MHTHIHTNSATEAVSNSTAEVPPVEGGEDEPDKGQHTIEEALSELGLSELSDSFKKEQIDYDSLVSWLVLKNFHFDTCIFVTSVNVYQ